jgi:hypothetical protein
LATILAHWQRKEQIVKPRPGLNFDNRLAPRPHSNNRRGGERRRRNWDCGKCALQPISEDMVLFGALVRGERFGGRSHGLAIAAGGGANKRN